MSVQAPSDPATPSPGLIAQPGLAITQDPQGLAQIHHASCAGVVWQREPFPAFQAWVDALPVAVLPRGRLVLRPGSAAGAVAGLCDKAGLADGSERARLIDDIAALADMFAGLSDAPYLRLRLEAVQTNACRLFHLDQITLRLICTYRGPGTQYGRAAQSAQPVEIGRVPTGSAIVLRGSLWPTLGEAGTRFLHRSPPIAGTGVTRLVLVLDPMVSLDDD